MLEACRLQSSSTHSVRQMFHLILFILEIRIIFFLFLFFLKGEGGNFPDMLLTSSHTEGQMVKNAKAAAWFMYYVVRRKEFCCRMSFSLIICYSHLNMSQRLKECQANFKKFLRVLPNEMHLDEVPQCIPTRRIQKRQRTGLERVL